MTDREMLEAKERADAIVDKVRSLVHLEDAVLQARDAAKRLSENDSDDAEVLERLELDLKTTVDDLTNITEELKLSTPCFRAYVLPQMSEIISTLKACDTKDREQLARLVALLTDEDSLRSTEELEKAIVGRLRVNIERTFSANPR